MCAVYRVDQLGGDAHTVSALSHRAFQHIADAKLAADLLYIDCPALVGEGGIAGDDEEPANAGQGRNDLLDHAVGEVFLLWIAAHILERQDCDRRLVRQRKRRFCPIIHWTDRWLATLLDTVDAHRPCDVLDPMLTEIGKSDRKFFADLLAHRRADADLTGCRKRLNSRRD